MTDFQDEEIHIEKYDPQWVQKFETEKLLLEKALGSWIEGGIHHVGSTAVPGLDAKPIIDIQIGIHNLSQAKECIPILEKIDYCYAPYKPYMHWLCKPSPIHREFHLQLMETSHPQWKARLTFRDYLRAHPDIAKQYAELKNRLAVQYRTDREGYTEAKTNFVESILAKTDIHSL